MKTGVPELCAPSSCLGGVLSKAASGFYSFVQACALCRHSPWARATPSPGDSSEKTQPRCMFPRRVGGRQLRRHHGPL